MEGKLKAIILCMFVFLAIKNINAQRYPITGNLVVFPPYSPYLTDMSNSIPDKINLNLLLLDANEPLEQIGLKLKINGPGISLESKATFRPSPIDLEYNIPLQLTGADLAAYFDPQNLNIQGLGLFQRTQFLNNPTLPEGLYTMCFEAFDYRRFDEAPASAEICFMFTVMIHEPPIIITPIGEQTPNDPQNLLFTWIPQHAGNFITNYTLYLYERTNPNDAPINVINGGGILIDSFETMINSYNYTGVDPLLEYGKEYVIRVRAFDVDEGQLFDNLGYSPIEIFTYGGDCLAPFDLEGVPTGTGEIDLSWSGELPNNGSTGGASTQTTAQAQVGRTSIGGGTSPASNGAINGGITATTSNPISGGLNPITTSPAAATATSSSGSGSTSGQFIIEYRSTNSASSNWIRAYTYENTYTLSGMELGESYEIRVGILCWGNIEVWTEIIEVQMPDFYCGIDPPTHDLSNSLLNSLVAGDSVYAGDFKVIVNEIYGGGAGRFTGTGYIRVPYLNFARINVDFVAATFNEDYKLIDGFFDVKGIGAQGLGGDWLNWLDMLLEAVETLDDFLDLQGMISGQIDELITFANTFMPPDIAQQLQDAQDALDNATTDQEIQDAMDDLNDAIDAFNEAMKELLNASYVVFFENNGQSKYGHDRKASGTNEIASNYEDAFTIGGGGNDSVSYTPDWKSIKTGDTEILKAILDRELSNISLWPDNTTFKTLDGTILPSSIYPDEDSIQLTINASTHENVVDVFAVENYTDQDGNPLQHIAGKMKVITLDPIEKKVFIVPVNGATYPSDPGTVEISLNKIFKGAAVNWTVQQINGFNSSFNNVMDDDNSGIWSTLTDQMKTIRNDFRYGDYNVDEDTEYIIFICQSSEDPLKMGYMPRAGHHGFIFQNSVGSNENLFQKTIAHELGHGAFHLKHTWKEHGGQQPENSTTNLMDVKENGKDLRKWQWMHIHDPQGGAGIFSDDEDDQLTAVTQMSDLAQFRNQDGTYTFVSPAGLPITLPSNTTEVAFNTGDEVGVGDACYDKFSIYTFGSLRYFKVDGFQFNTYIVCNSGDFAEYKKEVSGVKTTYIDTLTNKLGLDTLKSIVGFPCYDNQSIRFRVGQIKLSEYGVTSVPASNYDTGGPRKNYDFLFNYGYHDGVSIDITADAYPAYSDLAQLMLFKVQTSAQCGNKAALFAFIHAHQISAYPLFFEQCFETHLDNLSLDQIKSRIAGTYRDYTTPATDEFGVTYFPPEMPDLYDNLLSEEEYNSWKEKDRSIYKTFHDSYHKVLMKLDQYDSTDRILKELYKWRNDECALKALPQKVRIHVLDKLRTTEMDTWKFLGMREDKEEDIYNKVLATAPIEQYPAIYNLFKQNDYELFFNIANKMSGDMYDQLCNSLFEIVLVNDPNREVYESQEFNQNGGIDYVYHLSNSAGGSFVESQHHNMRANSFWGQIVDYDADFVATNKIRVKSRHENPNTGNWMSWIPSSDKPFEFVVLNVVDDLNFQMGTGGETLKKGTYAVPYVWADWLFRRYGQSNDMAAFRKFGAALAIISVPLTAGSSAPLVFTYLAGASAVWAVGDMLVFAPDQYDYEITGTGILPQELHTVWNITGALLGICEASGFFINATKAFNINKLGQTLKNIKTNAPTKMGEFRANLNNLYVKMASLAGQASDPANYQLLLTHLKNEMSAAKIYDNLVTVAQNAKFKIRNDTRALVFKVVFEAEIAASHLGDQYYIIAQSNRFIAANAPGYTKIASVKGMSHTDNAGGILKTDDLDVYMHNSQNPPNNAPKLAFHKLPKAALGEDLISNNLISGTNVNWTNIADIEASLHLPPNTTKVLDFWNDVSKEFYHLKIDDVYIKYNHADGTLFIGNVNNGKVLGFYQGLDNIANAEANQLPGILTALRRVHGDLPAGQMSVTLPNGAIINPTAGKTTILLGEGADFAYIVDNVALKMGNHLFGAKPGGYGVLNLSSEVWNANKANFWDDYNKIFVLKAMDRGDVFVTASNPLDNFSKLFREGMVPSGFAPANNYQLCKLLKEIPETNNLRFFGKEARELSKGNYIFKESTNSFIRVVDDIPSQTIRSLVVANQKLEDIYILFRAKGWDEAAHFSAVGNFAKNLDDVKLDKFKTFLNSLPEGSEGNTIINSLKSDYSNVSNIAFKNAVDGDPSILNGWKELHLAGKSFAKVNPTLINKFLQYSEDLKPYILKFSDDPNATGGSTIANFLNQSDADFVTALEENHRFMQGMVGHKLDDFDNSMFETLGDNWFDAALPNAYASTRTKVKTWINRSSKLQSFKEARVAGVAYGNNVVSALNLTGSSLKTTLATKLGMTLAQIEEYTVFKEVQLWVGNQKYMIADALLIKYVNGNVADVILIESKISGSTAFTVRQKEGWKKLFNSLNSQNKGALVVKAQKISEDGGTTLSANKTLRIHKNKIRKIHDEGDENGSFTVPDSPINIEAYKNYIYKPKDVQ